MGLASIQIISSFEDIEGKDEIKKVHFDKTNWDVIMNVKKDGSKVGDKVVYFEVNSLLPIKEEFEFLRKKCFSPSWNGFVIKAMKLGGMVSCGIALNIKEIKYIDLTKFKSGTDVTENLGVIKYDPEIRREAQESHKFNKFQVFLLKNKLTRNFFKWYFLERKRVKKSPYLTYVSKAGETNIQDYTDNILKRELKEFYVTEKLEGKNALYAIEKKKKKYEFIYCSHNVVFSNKDTTGNSNDYYRFAIINNLEAKMLKLAKELESNTLAISGELCGPSIQGNIYNLSCLKFFVFDIFLDGKLLPENKHNDICKKLEIDRVPCLSLSVGDKGSFPENFFSVEYWKSQATGKSVIGTCPNLREGIVVRNTDQLFGFKSKCKVYILNSSNKE